MSTKPTKFKGRLWIITDDKGVLIDDIDTDMIFHNAHLAITELSEMGQHTFGNLKGWEHIAKEAKENDIVMAGRNFGSGSSRQQAVDCFVSIGVKALVCESYGAIYKRNAINSGFPILIVPDLVEIVKKMKDLKHLQEVELDMMKGEILNPENGTTLIKGDPLSKVQFDIYHADGLLKFNPEN